MSSCLLLEGGQEEALEMDSALNLHSIWRASQPRPIFGNTFIDSRRG